MIINYVKGDATRPVMTGEDNVFIVHCCNDVGAWGAGFVMALSRRWPEPEQVYRASTPRLGDIQLVPCEMVTTAQGVRGITVCNLIGQHGCGPDRAGHPPIRYLAITEGLCKLRSVLDDTPDASVHCPRFGAGLAGGDWARIEAILERTIVAPLDGKPGFNVTVYDLP